MEEKLLLTPEERRVVFNSKTQTGEQFETQLLKAQLAKARPIIEKQAILNEQKRSSGALRELFKRGWALNDLLEAADTMEEAYTDVVEEAKKQERERIGKWLDSLCKHAPIYGGLGFAYHMWLPKQELEDLLQGQAPKGGKNEELET